GIGTPASAEGMPSDRPTRADVVKAAFANKRLDLVGRLRQKGPVQPFLFGSRLRGFADTDAKPWIASISAEDQQTLITDTLTEMPQRETTALPAAIVRAADGRDNGSPAQWDDVAAEAARLGVPIHVYGIGGSTAGFLQLKDAAIQDTLFVEDTV